MWLEEERSNEHRRAVKSVCEPQHYFLLVLHIVSAYVMPLLALQMAASWASGYTLSHDRWLINMTDKCWWRSPAEGGKMPRPDRCSTGSNFNSTSVSTEIPLGRLERLGFGWEPVIVFHTFVYSKRQLLTLQYCRRDSLPPCISASYGAE